jgi:hypothetical protein
MEKHSLSKFTFIMIMMENEQNESMRAVTLKHKKEFKTSIYAFSFIICLLSLLLIMPFAGLHFCVGLNFVTPLL